jgi:hypothetical protein
MRMAVVGKGGTVENIIEAPHDFEPGPEKRLIAAESKVQIGWQWGPDGFSMPPVQQDDAACVSDLQFRKALSLLGLREKTEELVEKGSQDMRDYWDRALEIDRHSPMVIEAARALGQSDAQLDEVFQLASTL